MLFIWVMPARGFAAGHATLAAALYAVTLCVAAPALAQGGAAPSDDLARRHFDSGVAYLEESDLENAMKAFQKAYDLSRRATILLNIATVQERRGDLVAAIQALEGYLSAEPQGEHAQTTRLRLQNLQKRLDAQADSEPRPPAPPPPAPPAPPVTAPRAVPAPELARAPAPARGDRSAPVAVYALFGLGGAGALTAVITGVLANGEYQQAKRECSPHCTRTEVRPGKTLALISTAATGVAIVGAGLGVTLLLTSSSSEASAPRTEVLVGMNGSVPGASVRHEF